MCAAKAVSKTSESAQLGKRFKRGPGVEELPEYARARHLLASLGMAKYQSNLKRGMLTDATLLLWNDRRALPCPAALTGARQAPRHRAIGFTWCQQEDVEESISCTTGSWCCIALVLSCLHAWPWRRGNIRKCMHKMCPWAAMLVADLRHMFWLPVPADTWAPPCAVAAR